MSNDITLCENCTNCYQTGPPWYWTCQRHPRLEGFGFVTHGTWDGMTPHLYCKNVNGGACPLFEPKKELEDA